MLLLLLFSLALQAKNIRKREITKIMTKQNLHRVFFSSEYMRSLTFVTRLLLIGICLEKKPAQLFVFL